MATLIKELEKAANTFDHIWEEAAKVTCGNLPHQIGQVRGLAINQAYLIRQWIKLDIGARPVDDTFMEKREGWVKHPTMAGIYTNKNLMVQTGDYPCIMICRKVQVGIYDEEEWVIGSKDQHDLTVSEFNAVVSAFWDKDYK